MGEALQDRRSPFAALTIALCWCVLLFLFLPVFITFPISLSDTRWLSMPTQGVSLRHFESLVTSPAWFDAIRESFAIGLCTAFLAILLGTSAAIGMWRLSNRLMSVLRGLILLPLIVPPVVTALGLYRMWVELGIYDLFLGVVLAHALLATPFVVITVSSSLALLDPRIEAASRSLGAGVLRTVWSVIVPNIRAGVLSGGLFAFVVSWDEIVVTLFVSNRNIYTLPRKMWDGIRQNIDPAVAAVATVLILMTIAIVAVVLVRQRRDSRD
jgi:putative spermidine/putrescine transport system permease protein